VSRLRPNRPPPSTAAITLNHCLPVHLQTRSITASKCSSQFTRARPPTASPTSLDHGLQVQLSVHSISASKSISHISKKHFRPGGMAPSEWTRSVRAVRDTPVADYSTPGVNATRRVAYCPPNAVSPFLLAQSVS
jgi:hypothetical protein